MRWYWYLVAPGLILVIHLGAFIVSLSLGAQVTSTAHLQPWTLLMPVIVVGGILGGVFTPTESAALGALAKAKLTSDVTIDLGKVLTEAEITKLQQIVRRVPAAEHVFQYARDLAREKS